VWQEATSLRDAGWGVTVICPAPTGVYAAPAADERGVVELEGIQVMYFGLSSADVGFAAYIREYVTAFFSVCRLSWKTWRRGRFEVLHICNPPDIFFPVMLFYRLLGAAVVYDHHDLFPEFVKGRFQGAAGRTLAFAATAMEYLSCQCAHLTIAVNESYREIAIQRGHVSPKKTVVVRNGPRIKEFSPVPGAAAGKRGYRFLVCYIGIMGHEDGIPEMLEAIRFVVKDLGRRDVFFYLMGEGALRTWAQQQITEWGLNDYVEMPGMVKDRTTIRQYLSSADLCLSPEPFSPLNAKSTFIKVGEYMAMGKPVVAFDLKETRFTASEAAVYVQPGDVQAFGQAISAMLDSPDQRAAMGMCGRERFQELLAWEHQEKHLLQAYERALNMARSVHG
jgi:glycosyltransferase involved in cell wall biosynthesis